MIVTVTCPWARLGGEHDTLIQQGLRTPANSSVYTTTIANSQYVGASTNRNFAFVSSLVELRIANKRKHGRCQGRETGGGAAVRGSAYPPQYTTFLVQREATPRGGGMTTFTMRTSDR